MLANITQSVPLVPLQLDGTGLGIVGYLVIALILVLIIGKITYVVPTLIIVPVIGALVAGFGPEELGEFVSSGLGVLSRLPPCLRSLSGTSQSCGIGAVRSACETCSPHCVGSARTAHLWNSGLGGRDASRRCGCNNFPYYYSGAPAALHGTRGGYEDSGRTDGVKRRNNEYGPVGRRNGPSDRFRRRCHR